ncbi:hypothetical protein D3C78_1553160 [compost metagenome]
MGHHQGDDHDHQSQAQPCLGTHEHFQQVDPAERPPIAQRQQQADTAGQGDLQIACQVVAVDEGAGGITGVAGLGGEQMPFDPRQGHECAMESLEGATDH